ncbi:hypothetical protein ECB94_09495 [Vibrio mediterranei]|uniref:Uncharacterized protein n=1 Tax=Vibrio mediterranei TaxID=689 RepID=A0A3G4VES4_9VIBR|nr:hypothetical protein ECB94_09495 [Vibrio mediterranei]
MTYSLIFSHLRELEILRCHEDDSLFEIAGDRMLPRQFFFSRATADPHNREESDLFPRFFEGII